MGSGQRRRDAEICKPKAESLRWSSLASFFVVVMVVVVA